MLFRAFLVTHQLLTTWPLEKINNTLLCFVKYNVYILGWYMTHLIGNFRYGPQNQSTNGEKCDSRYYLKTAIKFYLCDRGNMGFRWGTDLVAQHGLSLIRYTWMQIIIRINPTDVRFELQAGLYLSSAKYNSPFFDAYTSGKK